jgi:hypothetical protein
MLLFALALPAPQHRGIDPQVPGGFCYPVAMFGHQTDRFMSAFCCVLTSLKILHRTPPELSLSTLVKVSVFIKPHQVSLRCMAFQIASRVFSVAQTAV